MAKSLRSVCIDLAENSDVVRAAPIAGSSCGMAASSAAFGDVRGDAPCLVAGEQLGRRAPFLGQKQVSASGKVVVSDLEGFVLFFEQTGQLLDRPSTAGQVGRQLR